MIEEACTWEQQRQGSKKIRAAFTDTLKEHGVTGFGFAHCYTTCKTSGQAVRGLLVKSLD